MPDKMSLMKRSATLVVLVFGVLLGAAGAQKESVLYNFCTQHNCADGEYPSAGLIFDQKGNLYGTASSGGASIAGVVFKLTPDGKYAILYRFCSQGPPCYDGSGPTAGLIFDQRGNLYGTTTNGGVNGNGVVFKLTPKGKETVLHRFFRGDGANPYGGLVFDRKGNLYGTTYAGGGPGGNGVVFKVTPKGKETVLYYFCPQRTTNFPDGAHPYAGLVLDQEGNLFGTTTLGGINNSTECLVSCGVVFKVTPEGKETVLYRFCSQSNCSDGANPAAALVFDEKGNLYGTTWLGGTNGICEPGALGCGVVFKLTPEGKETVLHSFGAQGDGEVPSAGLIFDQKGNLYGTTSLGGYSGKNDNCDYGCGVVFKLTPKGRETVLYDLCSQNNCADGEEPNAALIFDRKGTLYGTTTYGGQTAVTTTDVASYSSSVRDAVVR